MRFLNLKLRNSEAELKDGLPYIKKTVPPEVEFSLFVNDDLDVEAYRSKKKLPIRDLINGFSNTLTYYSKIDAIAERLKVTP